MFPCVFVKVGKLDSLAMQTYPHEPLNRRHSTNADVLSLSAHLLGNVVKIRCREKNQESAAPKPVEKGVW